MAAAAAPLLPALGIDPEKVCRVIVKARDYDGKDVETDIDSASNAADDGMIAILEDHADDPVGEELTTFIDELNEDEQVDLVALAWLGRDSGGLEEWPELRQEAARAHNRRTAAYLLGMPLLPDYLEEGLAAFGEDCSRFEAEHL